MANYMIINVQKHPLPPAAPTPRPWPPAAPCRSPSTSSYAIARDVKDRAAGHHVDGVGDSDLINKFAY